MKNLKIVLMAVPLILLSQILFCQGHYVVTPANVVQTANEIAATYITPIQVSADVLTGHIEQAVRADSYDKTCQRPDLIFSGASENSVTLSWTAIPGAMVYELTYLNLKTGESGVKITAANQLVFDGLENGIYMFSVLSGCGGDDDDPITSSPLDIIIVDKPVLFELGDDSDCNCQLPDLIALHYPWQNKLRIDWNPEPDFRYEFNIKYHNGSESSMAITPVTTPFADPKLKFIVECFENMNYGVTINDNAFFAPNSTNDIQIYFRPSDYSFIITGAIWKINRAGIFGCATRKGGGNIGDEIIARQQAPATTIFPNPANDQVTIQYNSEINEQVDFLVYNNLGQLQFSQSINTNISNQIAIRNWSAGLYHFIFVENGHKDAHTFIKLNSQ